MTDEEALSLAKRAWPDAEMVSVHFATKKRPNYVFAHCGEVTLLEHSDPTRFEAALRVLAGE